MARVRRVPLGYRIPPPPFAYSGLGWRQEAPADRFSLNVIRALQAFAWFALTLGILAGILVLMTSSVTQVLDYSSLSGSGGFSSEGDTGLSYNTTLNALGIAAGFAVMAQGVAVCLLFLGLSVIASLLRDVRDRVPDSRT